MHRIVVFGATGRMGQSLIRALPAAPQFVLSGAIASAGGSRLGTDAAGDGTPSGVLVTSDAGAALRGATVAVDFSVPAFPDRRFTGHVKFVSAAIREATRTNVPSL